MEKINPRQQFITKELPNPETHYGLWQKYKEPTENLYLVDIPKEEFLYSSNETIISSIVGYFTKGINYSEKETIRYSTANWQVEFEAYLKFVWLAEAYINNSLKFPVGGHWNPRIERNVFHPGGSRNVVLNLFHTGPITTVYFNTNGKMFTWLNNAEIVKLEDLELKYNFKPQFILTADHGSLIPHVHFDAQSIDKHIIMYHDSIKNLIKRNIYVSHPLIEEFKAIPTTKDKHADIRITFKESPTIEDNFRAMMLCPIKQKRIEFNNIIIEKDL